MRTPVDTVRHSAHALSGGPRDHDPLLALIGEAHLVLLGEATHGTHEFYVQRADITRRLIEEKGFDAVAIEGDWPDSYRVNRFVRGMDGDRSAAEALGGFKRFPTWMWRNTDVVAFIDWLSTFNLGRPAVRGVGFYGLDLYSLHTSMAAVLSYLSHTDPAAAARARERYGCFDRHGEDSQRYGLLVGFGVAPSCEKEVIAMLVEIRRTAAQAALHSHDGEGAFDAEQNARLVKNAEAYYRAMVLRDESAWNLRDRHMAETLAELERHLARHKPGGAPKIVVWAHNSHVGDARATDMGSARGEVTLGQLVRERHGDNAVLVGFSTHRGHVTAANDWNTPHERMLVRPSRPDSYERLLHATGLDRFMLPLRDAPDARAALMAPRLQRAIGVIYRPESERQSHYAYACLPRQFDAVLHFSTTHAVSPLDRREPLPELEVPETYPSGM